MYINEVLSDEDIPNREQLAFADIGPEVTAICSKAFYECKQLHSVLFSEGLKSIGEDAFFNCWRLEEVSFPESLEYIGQGAFAWCSSLKYICIPQNVKCIS